jgi:hypothetical protein
VIYNLNQLTDIQNTIEPKFDERVKYEAAEETSNTNTQSNKLAAKNFFYLDIL